MAELFDYDYDCRILKSYKRNRAFVSDIHLLWTVVN
jgi:hypothetical protein